MSADSAILLVPYEQDPLANLAAYLLEQYPARPFDLSHITVLFPYPGPITRFHRALLKTAAARDQHALLPPTTGVLAKWLRHYADPAIPALDGMETELQILEALQPYPALKRRAGTWPLIDSLCRLFEDLTLSQCALPETPDDFRQRLTEAYGITAPDLPPLDSEASLAHTLWSAWQAQLTAEGCLDPALLHLHCLSRSLSRIPSDRHLILCGFTEFGQAEMDWIKALMRRGQLRLLLHGQYGAGGYHPDTMITKLLHEFGSASSDAAAHTPFRKFLDGVYSPASTDMRTRAQQLADSQPTSPAENKLHVYKAPNAESEARAVDIQVRRWRTQGLENIGIITNDRKLARRVRALLERAKIPIQDTAGWTLSTTSAAAALQRWLECVEENFAAVPLLDLLKSPFIDIDSDRDALHRTVALFECEVVLHENTASDLKRYRHALAKRKQTIDRRHGAGSADKIAAVLDRIESASEPLTTSARNQRKTATVFVQALLRSMETLGMSEQFARDEAGRQLLQELEKMHAAVKRGGTRFNWQDFHTWLQRTLERSRFRPGLRGGGVELMGFEQSRLYRFDAVVIAGATQEHLPGHIGHTPFFNERVRRQLGIPTLRAHTARLFYDFRRLLESAPQVLISYQEERNGESLIPCPWLQRLCAFHELTYRKPLDDGMLSRLIRVEQIQLIQPDALPAPLPFTTPAVSVPVDLMPKTVSASAHQRMLDCPYQFFAVELLGLKPVQPYRDELEKSDYGQRVHRILQAFHGGIAGLPGPWRGPLTTANITEAQQLLMEITAAVFADDLKDSLLARGWLYRWQPLIPGYLEWQRRRGEAWTVHDTERELTRHIGDGTDALLLTGRLDRLDKTDQGYAIIDYKTGEIPKLESVLTGEHAQLLFYTLLLDAPVNEALILSLGNEKLSDKLRIEAEALTHLQPPFGSRLIAIHRAVREGMALPAWGDAHSCDRCSMEGLCRKAFWVGTDDAELKSRQKKGGLSTAFIG